MLSVFLVRKKSATIRELLDTYNISEESIEEFEKVTPDILPYIHDEHVKKLLKNAGDEIRVELVKKSFAALTPRTNADSAPEPHSPLRNLQHRRTRKAGEDCCVTTTYSSRRRSRRATMPKTTMNRTSVSSWKKQRKVVSYKGTDYS
ncbi:uncharacterized protein LOC117176479 [Belonocnema kinseyi]|uniref:uncharacterized protein LOC117176479 n=1 Tax=Belonocnema kinseyi TaxID=2817044 RepID=UPI00143D3331|nr:uncharacterized protein LOC117176479 [Belonocnema kinseyi]